MFNSKSQIVFRREHRQLLRLIRYTIPVTRHQNSKTHFALQIRLVQTWYPPPSIGWLQMSIEILLTICIHKGMQSFSISCIRVTKFYFYSVVAFMQPVGLQQQEVVVEVDSRYSLAIHLQTVDMLAFKVNEQVLFVGKVHLHGYLAMVFIPFRTHQQHCVLYVVVHHPFSYFCFPFCQVFAQVFQVYFALLFGGFEIGF